jgi:Uma2 family endonuclease
VVGIPVLDSGPMTVEEFYALTDTRPDNEKWELIDGEAVFNASPADFHQEIVANIIFTLTSQLRENNAPWVTIPGIGVLVSDVSRPEPDIMIVPRRLSRDEGAKRDTTEAAVLFEIMSPSTSKRDLHWKRTAYTGMAKLTHYVVVAQDAIDVVVLQRDDRFAERRLHSLAATIDFPALGISLPLSEIYRDTGLV